MSPTNGTIEGTPNKIYTASDQTVIEATYFIHEQAIYMAPFNKQSISYFQNVNDIMPLSEFIA